MEPTYSFSLNSLLEQYSISMGSFIFGAIIGIILVMLILTIISMISGRIVQAPNAKFSSAILVSVSYFFSLIVIVLLYQFIPAEIYFSRGFEVFHVVVCFFILSFFYSRFFRISFPRGLLTTFITAVIMFALVFVLGSIVSQ